MVANAGNMVSVVVPEDVALLGMVVFESVRVPTGGGYTFDGEQFESRLGVRIEFARLVEYDVTIGHASPTITYHPIPYNDAGLFDMAFAAELVCILVVIAPLDGAFLVLPVPRLDDHDIALVDPYSIFHSAGNTTHAFDAIHTAHANVIPAVVFGDDPEDLVVVWHSEVLPSGPFTHTVQYVTGTLKPLETLGSV